MKNYKVNLIVGNETMNECYESANFSSLSLAQEAYDNELVHDGSKEEDWTNHEVELIEVDGDGEHINTIASQSLYVEGQIDRNNYKGDYASMYGFEAYYSFEVKELIYKFLFLGEPQGGEIRESELSNWYNR